MQEEYTMTLQRKDIISNELLQLLLSILVISHHQLFGPVLKCRDWEYFFPKKTNHLAFTTIATYLTINICRHDSKSILLCQRK